MASEPQGDVAISDEQAENAVVTFNEDVVRFFDEETQTKRCGLVIRCWRDEQDAQSTQLKLLNPNLESLKQNEIVLNVAGERAATVNEQSVEIVDRYFLVGDTVVRCSDRANNPMRGLVAKTTARYKVAPFWDPRKTPLEPWFTDKDVTNYIPLARNDLVIYEKWIGMIEEVIEAAAILDDHDTVIRTCGPFGSFLLGADCEPEFPDHQSAQQSQKRKVLDIQQTAASVNWLCMNQLDQDVPPEKTKRPKRYWNNLDKLSLVHAQTYFHHTISDPIQFKDDSLYQKYPVTSFAPRSELPSSKVLTVVDIETRVTVNWQDGTTTSVHSVELESFPPIDDDLDVFPGEVVAHIPAGSSSSEAQRAGVVQSMKASARTVNLKWYGTDQVEVVPSIEIDAAGPPEAVFGVRVLDPVLLAPSSGNGEKAPLVPRLGESEVAAGLWPSIEEHRASLAFLGVESAMVIGTFAAPRPKTDMALSNIRWFGTVSSTNLDGSVTVRFPDGAEDRFQLERLFLLDATPRDPNGDQEALDDDEDDAGSMMSIDPPLDPLDNVIEMHQAASTADDQVSPADHVQDIVLDADAGDVNEGDVMTGMPSGVKMPGDIEDDDRWQRFITLEEVPEDHHFANQPELAAARGFSARVRKEYGILASSLPPNILVRVYEGRTDLMRALIIGPTGTPFANAPFLFDVYLKPTTFPQEPPAVYFHSWAGGTRVSPNLYAEGKVCLSLLGTWQGDKTEGWSSTQSSLLQVFVSIQALIMVPEPYYTEPGLEKEKGTAKGMAASQHYSERTYTLTRGFVKRACEFPPASFETEIKAYYFDGLPSTGPGALPAIIEEGKRLVEESEAWATSSSNPDNQDESEATRPESAIIPSLKVLTEGACLALKRTLGHLDKIQASSLSSTTSTSASVSASS